MVHDDNVKADNDNVKVDNDNVMVHDDVMLVHDVAPKKITAKWSQFPLKNQFR